MNARPRSHRSSWPVLAAAAFLLLASAALWIATGREGFTRWPNSKLAASDRPAADHDDLLSSLGFEEGPDDTEPTLVNKFAFGLLPGGFDARHLPSVLLGAGVSGLLFATVALRAMSTRHTQGGTP
jgi:hypothetical protein